MHGQRERLCVVGGGMHGLGVHGMGSMCGGGACMAGEHVWWGGGMRGRGTCVVGACVAGGGVRGRRDDHFSGRYASYWNAFLFCNIFANHKILLGKYPKHDDNRKRRWTGSSSNY